MNRTTALVASVVVAGLATPAAAACKMSRIQYNFDQVTSTTMEIDAAQYCAGSFNFPNMRVTKVVVPNQPRKGLVSVDQKTFVWRYRPFKDFRGEDFFALKIYAYNSKRTSDGTIVFRVRVK